MQMNVKVTLFGSHYSVPFPTVQQLIDIENTKQLISSGNYGMLARTKTRQSENALNFVDAISTFVVLIPKLTDAISEKDLMNLDALKAKELIKQYVGVYYPWYTKLETEINEASVIEDDDVEEEINIDEKD